MTVTCEFCNASYRFARDDVAAIAAGRAGLEPKMAP